MTTHLKCGAKGRTALHGLSSQHLPLSLGGECQAGLDVFLREIGKVVKNFRGSHARSQVRQNVVDGDSHASNARTAAAFSSFHRDS